MKPKKHSRKPLPLALVVETAIALQSRPENKDKRLNELLIPARDFLWAAEHLIAAKRNQKLPPPIP